MALSSKEREREWLPWKSKDSEKLAFALEKKKKKRPVTVLDPPFGLSQKMAGISPAHAQSWLIQCGPFRKTKQKKIAHKINDAWVFLESLMFQKFLHRNVKDEKMAQFLVDVFDVFSLSVWC